MHLADHCNEGSYVWLQKFTPGKIQPIEERSNLFFFYFFNNKLRTFLYLSIFLYPLLTSVANFAQISQPFNRDDYMQR